MDLKTLDQQSYQINGSGTEYFDGKVQELNVVKETISSYLSSFVWNKESLISYSLGKIVKIRFTDEYGTISDVNRFIVSGKDQEISEAEVQTLFDSLYQRDAASQKDLPNLFSVKFVEFKEMIEKVGKVCAKVEEDKHKKLRTNPKMAVVPEINFNDLARELRLVSVAFEDFFLNSFSYDITDRKVNINGTEEKYFLFNYGSKKDSSFAENILENSIIGFTLAQNSDFFKNQTSIISSDYEEVPTDRVNFEKWFDIKYVQINALNGSSEPIFIARPFLFGNYELVYESFQNLMVRNIFLNLKTICEEYYSGEKLLETKIDWEEFCTHFIRPTIFVYEDDDFKIDETKVSDKKIKTIEEKLQEDKKVYSVDEKASIVNKNAGKKESVDNGNLDQIKSELSAASTVESLYDVLFSANLSALAMASFDCINKTSSINLNQIDYNKFDPYLSNIPKLSVPKLSFPRLNFPTSPTEFVMEQAIQQMKRAALQSVVASIEKYFSVKQCSDFNNFFNKSIWDKFSKDIVAFVLGSFEDLLEVVNNVCGLINVPKCFPRESFLIFLYKSSDVFTPFEVFSILSGASVDARTNRKIRSFMDAILYKNFPTLSCEPVDLSQIRSVFFEVGKRVRPQLEQIKEDVLSGNDVDVVYESAIKCQNSYDSFVNWLYSNGVPKEKLECLAEKNLQERSEFLTGLYKYIDNSGVSRSQQLPFIIDDQTRNLIKTGFDAQYHSIFDEFSSIFKDYSLFCVNGSYDGGVVNDEDLVSLSSSLPDSVGIDFLRETVGPNEKAIDSIEPFYHLKNKLFLKPSFYDPIYPEFQYFKFFSEQNEQKKEDFFRFTDEFSNSVVLFKRKFGSYRGHKRLLNVGGKDYDIVGHKTNFENDEYQDLFSFWRAKFSSEVTKHLPSSLSANMLFWKDYFRNDGYDNFLRVFVLFLIKEFENSMLLKKFSFNVDGAVTEVSGVDLFSKFFSEINQENCEDGYCSLFGYDDIKEKVSKEVEGRMRKERKYNFSHLDDVGLIDVSFREQFLRFFGAVPFMGSLFSRGNDNSTVLFSYLQEFLGLCEKDKAKNYYKSFDFENYYTSDDVSVLNGGVREEEIDTSFTFSQKLINLEQNNFNYDIADLKRLKNFLTTSECFESVQRGFAKFFGSSCGPISKFVQSLPVIHFNEVPDETPFIFSLFPVNYNKNWMVGIEIEYFIDGVWRKVRTSSSNSLSGDGNLYVDYGSEQKYSILELKNGRFSEKIRANVSLFMFKSRLFIGRLWETVDESGLVFISPVFSSEVPLSLLYGSEKTNENDLLSEIKLFLGKEAEKSEIFVDMLRLEEVFDAFNVFLFDVASKTTNILNIFEENAPENQVDDTVDNYFEKNFDKFSSDTFGLLRTKYSVTGIQKMALKMALQTPWLIFKSTVEMTDPVIRKARKKVDLAAVSGERLTIKDVILGQIRPINIFPGIGSFPLITPAGIIYMLVDSKKRTVEDALNSDVADLESVIGEQLFGENQNYSFGSTCLPVKTVEEELEFSKFSCDETFELPEIV